VKMKLSSSSSSKLETVEEISSEDVDEATAAKEADVDVVASISETIGEDEVVEVEYKIVSSNKGPSVVLLLLNSMIL